MAWALKRRGIFAALLALGALGTGARAEERPAESFVFSTPRDPFTALVGKRDSAPADPAERFRIESDGRLFLLEDRRSAARIKYLCGEDDPRLDCRVDPAAPAEEIFILTKTSGPRGDTIYRDAAGEVRLRVGAYGGATVYWPGESAGLAAARAYGQDGALVLTPADFATASRRAQGAAAHLSALAAKPILFDIGQGAPGEDASVLADAVVRIASGMQIVAADATGARVLGSRIKLVRFLRGAPPRLALNGETFNVVYDPAAGLAGRPSSRAVARFLEDNL